MGQRVERLARRSTPKTARICRWSCRFSPTPGSSCATAMPCCAQQRRRADARELQQLRRADRAGGQDHRARRRAAICAPPSSLRHSTPRGRAARRRRAARARSRCTIAPVRTCRLRAALHRPQEGLAGVPAHAALLVDLEVADAFVVAAVEVVAGAGCRPAAPPARRRRAAPTTGAGVSTRHSPPALADASSRIARAAPMSPRGCMKYGRHASQRQPSSPSGVGPAVVVARLAAHVDHAVDARRAAEHLAARIAQHAAVQPGVGLGLVQPVGARVADAVQIADRDVDPGVVVAAAGFEQQHARVRVGRQPVGEQAAGGAGADDDVVPGGRVAHRSLPSPRDVRGQHREQLDQPVGQQLDRHRGEDQAHQPRHDVDAGAAEHLGDARRGARRRRRSTRPMTTP